MGISRIVWMIVCVVPAVIGKESFNTTPPPISSDFSCTGRPMGYYADVGTKCRAYHMCDDHGNHFTHYCPEDTAFRQDAMICDHAYLVDCRVTEDNVPRLGSQDDNHDAPPQSFVEPRGEGSNARGYARSFRINPDSKGQTGSKYPTFVLNSSVFLTNRNSNARKDSSETRSQESESSRTRVTPNDFQNDAPAYQSQEIASTNALPTTPVPALSKELQPPIETTTSRTARVFSSFEDDEFAFLVPPPERDDNVYFQKIYPKTSKIDTFNYHKDSLAPIKNDNFNFQKDFSTPFKNDNFDFHKNPTSSFKSDSFDFPKSSFDSLKTDSFNDNFEKAESHGTVTFTPRTKMILEMVKARAMGRESSADFPILKPVNFLQPPTFKSDFSNSASFGRSNFNFRNDDYPYVETLRSIQKNKVSTISAFSNPATKFATSTMAITTIPTTEASIFAVPTKPLNSAGEVEHDPYYPRTPSTTEAYYTPRHQMDKSRKPYFTTTRKPQTSSQAKFQIPAVLPDLNSLEDLLDRRKFFFIPKVKST